MAQGDGGRGLGSCSHAKDERSRALKCRRQLHDRWRLESLPEADAAAYTQHGAEVNANGEGLTWVLRPRCRQGAGVGRTRRMCVLCVVLSIYT